MTVTQGKMSRLKEHIKISLQSILLQARSRCAKKKWMRFTSCLAGTRSQEKNPSVLAESCRNSDLTISNKYYHDNMHILLQSIHIQLQLTQRKFKEIVKCSYTLYLCALA